MSALFAIQLTQFRHTTKLSYGLVQIIGYSMYGKELPNSNN